MPKYTEEQQAHAVTLAAQEGITPAAKATGINPGTIRRWAKARRIAPAAADPARVAQTEAATETAKVVAAAARAETSKAATVDLAKLGTDSGRLAINSAQVFGTSLQAVGEAEVLALGYDKQLRELPDGDPSRPALEGRRDAAWDRVRLLSSIAYTQARTYGIATDKLVKLAEGDTIPAAPAGSSVAVQVAVGILLGDPDVRETITAGLAERVAARRGEPITVELP
jgi:hypothetical protein